MTNKNYKDIHDIDDTISQWLTDMNIKISLRSQDIAHEERVLTIDEARDYRAEAIE
jgi:hypothetical protein